MFRGNSRFRASACAVVLSCLLSACGGGDDPGSSEGTGGTATTDEALEIWSWWADKGEQNALDALVNIYSEQFPEVRVMNVQKDTSDMLRDDLSDRFAQGNPPDAFQVISGGYLNYWLEDERRVEDLQRLFEDEGWTDDIPEDVLSGFSDAEGIYAVPVGIHRTNLMFYSTAVLDEHGIKPPTTWDEWYLAADQLQAAGISPLAIGLTHPWTGSLLFSQNLIIAQGGPELYLDLFGGQLDRDQIAENTQIRAAFEQYVRLLSYANPDYPDLDWSTAMAKLVDGTAAFTVMGDWARGYFMAHENWEPDKEFGVMPTPGTEAAFVFDTDAFAMPRGATHPSAAREFLRVVGSQEGQVAFSRAKGSIPPRTSATTGLDSQAGLNLSDFNDLDRVQRLPVLAHLVTVEFEAALFDIIAELDAAETPDVDLALANLEAAYKSYLVPQ